MLVVRKAALSTGFQGLIRRDDFVAAQLAAYASRIVPKEALMERVNAFMEDFDERAATVRSFRQL